MLSVAIQAHPRRAHLVAALVAALEEPVDVVFDPEPDGDPNAWRTYRLCLERTPADCDHRLILQDDVTPSVGFLAAARTAVAAHPDRVVSFYLSHQRENLTAFQRAEHAGERYCPLNLRRWLPVVATSWPASAVADVLAWVDAQRWPRMFRADDEIAGRACRALHLDAVATVPSLVQHEDVVPSLLGRRHRQGHDPARVAYRWLQPPDDARSLAW